MDVVESGQRISLKRARPNPLFQSWLEELHDEAKQKKSKLENMLQQALTSISKYPLPLQSGAECAILNGFNKQLCIFLDKRLKVYNTNKKLLPSTIAQKDGKNNFNSNPVSNVMTTPRMLASTSTSRIDLQLPSQLSERSEQVVTSPESSAAAKVANPVVVKGTPKISYKPSYRSGGYAIILALFKHSNSGERKPLDKETIIEHAERFSDDSFRIVQGGSIYTAWANMERLIIRGLVKRRKGKKTMYTLTDKGYLLARDLVKHIPLVPVNIEQFTANGFRRLSCKECIDSITYEIVAKDSSSYSQPITSGNSQIDYIEMAAESFDIILLIDKNETNGTNKRNDPTMASFKKHLGSCVEYRSLKVGDYMWVARNRNDINEELVLPFIVERKRIDDLAASIKDGRFHEQKFRLRRCGIENVLFVIENFGSKTNLGLPYQTLMQALANTRIQNGFMVHMTKSMSYTVSFLALMTKRLTDKYKDKNLQGWDKLPEEDKLMTFEYFNKSSVKNRPLTVTETFIKLLLQLKGLSVQKALAITSKYKTPYSLFTAYKDCNQKEGEMLLANLKFGKMNRNVGPAVSKTIYQLFTKST